MLPPMHRLACSLIILLVCGCSSSGPPTGAVTGKVLLDGVAITSGNVITLPNSGKGANGVIQPDGTFRLKTVGLGDFVVAGNHRVAVVAYKGEQSAQNPEATGQLLVPQRYIDVATSGLSIDVVAGETKEVTLELTTLR
jgi:hypothetical protein